MAFRDMRRNKQQLSQEDCVEILNRSTSGVLAVSGDDGYPYAVPLSYVYYDGCIYFHCAKSGHKLDAINNCDKVSFCVIDRDEIVPEKFTTYFRSVIAFGRARVMESEAEIHRAIERIAAKYSPNETLEHRDAEIEDGLPRMAMIELKIEHMTGKEAIELVNARS